MDTFELLSTDDRPARARVVVVPTGREERAAVGFDELYRDEYPGMVRLAYLLVRDRELAVEVTHDAFARVLERWSKLDRPGAYLRTAVVNASRDALRRRIFRRSRSHVVGLVETTSPARDDSWPTRWRGSRRSGGPRSSSATTSTSPRPTSPTRSASAPGR